MVEKMKKAIKEACGRKIVDVTNGKIYETVTEAENDNKLKNLSNHLKGRCKTFNKKVFKYLEEWDGQLITQEELYALNKNPSSQCVVHIETGRIYESLTKASVNLNISRGSIRKVCNGISKQAKNQTFQYVK